MIFLFLLLFMLATLQNAEAARLDVNSDLKLLIALAISTFIGVLYMTTSAPRSSEDSVGEA
jgi:hypothetical protein